MVMNALETTATTGRAGLIPDSAPFSDEQRAWLNGFLAGWMGIADGAASDAASSATATAPPPEEDEDFPWHDPAMAMDDRLKLAEAKPLPRKLMAAMAQLDCGACGYVCQTYAEAIATGNEKDTTRCSPGGAPTAKMLKQILKDAGGPSTATASGGIKVVPSVTVEGDKPAGYSRDNPFPAILVSSTCLNGPGSSKDVRHVVIDLAGSGLTYKVGDALGVYPTNCPELVEALITRLNASGGERVTTATGTTTSLRKALTEHVNLKNFDEDVIALLIDATSNGDVPRLQELASNVSGGADAVADMDVLDLLEMFPRIAVDPAALVARLHPLRPRLYSIASSLKAHPDQVHLTVGKVTATKRGRLRRGVASCMFAERIRPGDTVRVFVQPSHGFTVPADSATPIIMIGPGTGIAPFRAFLEERAASTATGAVGANWLFFGDQHAATDFLYEHELRDYQARGILTRLDTAFSRDQAEKIYVQTRMIEHGAELWQWLERGAHLYVCGDAKRMAPDVDAALKQLITTHGHRTPDDAAAYITALTKASRYQRDVY